jgi:hypothetical protein
MITAAQWEHMVAEREEELWEKEEEATVTL